MTFTKGKLSGIIAAPPGKNTAAAAVELNPVWSSSDYLGALMVRAGIGRKNYRVHPGLYKVGSPDKNSPVFVTANYKLSVNHLKRALKNIDSWIVVLNTKGINVWCAAGKGTFGTRELINRIEKVDLANLVDHRRIILPQLGAPGIAPPIIRGETGFAVIYGPVEANDLPQFLANGLKANASMRRKQFHLKERLTVSFTHFIQALIPAVGLTILFSLADKLFLAPFPVGKSLIENSGLVLTATFAGSLGAGALLPLLPGRAFSLKGLFAGLLYTAAWGIVKSGEFSDGDLFYFSGKLLFLLCLIIYQVLNLTGSSTYTSLSGVRKEMRICVPLLISGTAAALVMIIVGGVLI